MTHAGGWTPYSFDDDPSHGTTVAHVEDGDLGWCVIYRINGKQLEAEGFSTDILKDMKPDPLHPAFLQYRDIRDRLLARRGMPPWGVIQRAWYSPATSTNLIILDFLVPLDLLCPGWETTGYTPLQVGYGFGARSLVRRSDTPVDPPGPCHTNDPNFQAIPAAVWISLFAPKTLRMDDAREPQRRRVTSGATL